MTTPPGTCPACGSHPTRRTDTQVNFECGACFVYIDVSDYLHRGHTPRFEWTAVGVGGCQRVYESALQRGEEIERLKLVLLELHELAGESTLLNWRLAAQEKIRRLLDAEKE